MPTKFFFFTVCAGQHISQCQPSFFFYSLCRPTYLTEPTKFFFYSLCKPTYLTVSTNSLSLPPPHPVCVSVALSVCVSYTSPLFPSPLYPLLSPLPPRPPLSVSPILTILKCPSETYPYRGHPVPNHHRMVRQSTPAEMGTRVWDNWPRRPDYS